MQTTNSDHDATLTQAQSCHRAGQLSEALALYFQVLKAAPERGDVWHKMGLGQFQSGHLATAETSLRRAIECEPSQAMYHNSLGMVVRAQDRVGEAAACYRQALELAPEMAGAAHGLASALRDLGEWEEAAQNYRRAIELGLDSAQVHANLGVASFHLGRPEESIASYRRALERDPEHASALHGLGVAMAERGDLNEAVEAYQRAIKIRPQFIEAHNSLGIALRRLGRAEDAAKSFRQVLDLDPSPEAYHNLANVLRPQNLDEAADNYLHAVELAPDFAEGHLHLANARFAQSRWDEALASYRRAVELEPDSADFQASLGIALLLRAGYDEAVECLKRAVALRPEFTEARLGLGAAYQAQDEPALAVECYQAALAIRPNDGDLYDRLAHAYLQLGEIDKAGAIWQQWKLQEPENAVARHMVAAVTGQEIPSRASDDYVREVFDSFAECFDAQLRALHYRGPQLVVDALAAALEGRTGIDVLDAGCGTGLCGPLLVPMTRRLVGVDLSNTMLEKARARKAYHELIAGELVSVLSAHPESYDAVTAADTLVYFGDLVPFVAAARDALRPDGLLVFTVEKAQDGKAVAQGFVLEYHGRYCHTEEYLRSSLTGAGLEVLRIEPAQVREERGEPVHGLVTTARKRPG